MSYGSGHATIKEVISGDTFILIARPNGKPPPERKVTLSHVIAPKLPEYRRNPHTEIDPLAWKSREFARVNYIGAEVTFKVEEVVEKTAFGSIQIEGESLATKLLSSGWVKLNLKSADPSVSSEYMIELEKAEEEAKAKKLGIWDATGEALPPLEVTNLSIKKGDEHLQDFFERNKQQKLKAIVENVKDGSTFAVLFLDEMVMADIFISGVQCDPIGRGGYEGEYAAEAKYFLEIRVLNRELQIRVEGYNSEKDALYASLYHPNGNISEILLKKGYATLNNQTAQLAESYGTLFDCVEEAKKSKLRKWKELKLPSAPPSSTNSFTATVYEVVSAESFLLLSPTDLTLRKVFLSYVRCPRMAIKDRPGEAWAYEAWDFSRRELIGKTVEVCVDYTKEGMFNQNQNGGSGASGNAGSSSNTQNKGIRREDDQTLMYVSIQYDNSRNNITEKLLEKGFARLIPLREEIPKSSNYGQLLDLDRAAKQQSLGVHGPASASPPVKHVLDISGINNTKKGTAYLRELKEELLNGVVLYVFNPAMYKIFLPSRLLNISFALAGVSVPNSGGSNKKSDKYDSLRQDAINYARMALLNRDVSIRIDSCSAGGFFLGSLIYKKHVKFATELLDHGYVSIKENYGSNFSPNSYLPPADMKAFVEAQERAKEGERGMWHMMYMDEEASKDKYVDEVRKSVFISHISSVMDFYIQTSTSKEMEKLSRELKQISLDGGASLEFGEGDEVPATGDIVIARFPHDNEWYRASIESYDARSGDFEVFYVDFGNSESLKISDLMKCPEELAVIPLQSTNCQLSGVVHLAGKEDEAAQGLLELTEEHIFDCLIEKFDFSGKAHIILYDGNDDEDFKGTEVTVNQQIISGGYGAFMPRSKTRIAKALRAAEAACKNTSLEAK